MSERPDTPDLTNPRAQRVKAVRALSGRSARERHGQFLVEGPQGVREVLRYTPAMVRDLYLTGAAAQRYPEIVTAADAADVRRHLGTEAVLQAMSADAQGVLAVARIEIADGLGLLTLDPPPTLVTILAQVRDPGNAGTVIRAADAAGADAVLLSTESVQVHNPKTVRSSAGSMFHLPVVPGMDLDEAITAARAAGMNVLAADGSGELDLQDLADGPVAGIDLAAPTMWLLGNEAHGLSESERALADAEVRIGMHRAESLNLAMAATLCLYASARAQRKGRR